MREALLVLAVTVPLVYVTWAVSTVEQVVDSVATFVVAPASVSIAGTLWLGAFVSTLALRLWVGARSHLTHSNIST